MAVEGRLYFPTEYSVLGYSTLHSLQSFDKAAYCVCGIWGLTLGNRKFTARVRRELKYKKLKIFRRAFLGLRSSLGLGLCHTI